MRLFVRNNGLSLFFGLLFLATLIAESVVGHSVYNSEQLQHGDPGVSYGRYLVSSHFGEAVLENWQSEWLQFILFGLATVWLLQRGSPESKQSGEEGLQSDEKQLIGGRAPDNAPRWAKLRGWREGVYGNSFLIVMLVIYLGSWLGQSTTAWTEFNNTQRQHDEEAVSWLHYLGKPDFWEKSLQNWQSEFLALGTMVILTVYLRQRGSPESKPVGAPHDETSTNV
jgi:hypothetical protein